MEYLENFYKYIDFQNIYVYVIYFLEIFASLFILNFFDKRFKISFKYQVFSIITSVLSLLYITSVYKLNIEVTIFSTMFLLLMYFSFIDIKYYELANLHYLLIGLFSLAGFIFSIFSGTFMLHILSFIAVFGTFLAFDKFIGIEKLGGADVKVMMVMAVYFEITDVLYFVLMTFLISTVIFVLERIVRKTFCDLQVPMIVSICISFFITTEGYFINLL